MNIFEAQREKLKEARKPSCTVIKVTDYKLGQEPGQHRIIGQDIYNKDENGVPKTVEVAIHNTSSNVMGVKDFARRGSLVHTEKGGLIRLDRFIKRGAGDEYVAQHAQRLTVAGDMMRTDDSGENYKIAFDRAWVKVKPIMDFNTRQPREFATRNGVIHRATAMIIPEDTKPTTVALGASFADALKQLASKAIDAAPEKTQPLVMIRDTHPKNVSEMRVPNMKKDANNQYVPMNKEEMLEAFMETGAVQALVEVAKDVPEGEIEGITGFSVNVFGNPYNDKNERVTSRVEALANETVRRFPKPDVNGQPQKPELGNQEYALSIASYSISQGERANANLESLGRFPGVKASPNAGLSVTPNPYFPDAPTSAAPQQAAQAAPAQPASSPAQASYAAQAPAAQSPAPGSFSDEPPLPSDEDLDSLLGDEADYDMDELESQLAGVNL